MPGRSGMLKGPLRSAAGLQVRGRWAELLLFLTFALSLRIPRPGGGGWPWWLWGLWLAGLGGAFALALSRRRREGQSDAAALAVTTLSALLLLNAGIALSGGVQSPLWPGYVIFLAAAASRFSRWWQQPLLWAAVAALEIGQTLFSAAGSGAIPPDLPGLAFRLALLGVFSLILHLLFTRRQNRLRESLHEHVRLREEAEHFQRIEEDGSGDELKAHSPEGKMIRRMSVAEKLNRDLDRLLELARQALDARTVILLNSDGDRLVFRRAASAGVRVDGEVSCRIGEGVVGGAAKLGRSVTLSDMSTGRHRVNLTADGKPPLSLMVVPVKEQEVLRGVLVADHPEAEKFSKGELEVFEGFSLEVNLLLENFRESSLRDRRQMTMETLNALSEKLTSTLKIDEMLESLVDGIREVIPYDQCALFLVDGKKRLKLHAQRGFRFEPDREVFFPLKKGLVGYIVAHGQPLVFSDRKKMEIIPGYTGMERVRSFMGMPLRFGDELEGAMIFASAERGNFTHYHLETLQLLGRQLSAQITNAFLHGQVERMSLTDGLTGLYNHRHFQEQLSHEVERADRHGEHLSLLLLDLDHFKNLNDSYGHPFGDVVLREVSDRLKETARNIDFVARYGGEEFAVILASTGERGCRSMARRILNAVRVLAFKYEGENLSVTISVGSATFPREGKTKEELLSHADQALYLAKATGRDRYRSFSDVLR